MQSRRYPTYKKKYRVENWKLHLGVDRSGVIVAHALTKGHVADATTAITLIDAIKGDIASLTRDAAYDSIAVYDAAGARGATAVVPPTKTARVSRRRPRSSARDRTITQVTTIGRRRWKKESGYHRQARGSYSCTNAAQTAGGGYRAMQLKLDATSGSPDPL